MKRLRFTGLLLEPSVSGLIGTIIAALLVLFVTSLAYSIKSGFIYDLLLGPDSSADLIQTSRDTITALTNTVFGNPVLNKVLFFMFWMVIGLVVYLIVSGLGSGINEADKALHELQYANMRRLQLQESFMLRAMLRAITAMVWFAYSILFIKFFLPFSVLSTRVGLNQLNSVTGWGLLLAAFVTLTTSLHLHIVLLRLFCLRPRVFGGWDVVGETHG
jgi:hypothetical protein